MITIPISHPPELLRVEGVKVGGGIVWNERMKLCLGRRRGDNTESDLILFKESCYPDIYEYFCANA